MTEKQIIEMIKEAAVENERLSRESKGSVRREMFFNLYIEDCVLLKKITGFEWTVKDGEVIKGW